MQSSVGKRVFVAGAGGVIGRRMCHLLVTDGYTVIGTTRKPKKIAALEALGVTPVVVNVFDPEALHDVVVDAKPDIVVHQLTDLPQGLDPKLMADARYKNARVREIGTRNLINAAMSARVDRIIAQSIAFAYAPGTRPYEETAPLNVNATDDVSALTARAVASLEQQVLNGPFTGIVLRYGRLYGPGTGFDVPPPGGPVHVDAAADAARRAITLGQSDVYNIAEEDGTVSIAKARKVLKWEPDFRIANS